MQTFAKIWGEENLGINILIVIKIELNISCGWPLSPKKPQQHDEHLLTGPKMPVLFSHFSQDFL